jgi:hypothetical protein
MSSTLPLDMLGGLAKANTWVVKPEGYNFLLLLPLNMLGGLAQSQPKGRSTEDTIPNGYKPSVATSMLGR